MLPFPVGDDGRFPMFYWWGQRLGARIVPTRGLDPVEAALVVTGPPWTGLPVAARALAA